MKNRLKIINFYLNLKSQFETLEEPKDAIVMQVVDKTDIIVQRLKQYF